MRRAGRVAAPLTVAALALTAALSSSADAAADPAATTTGPARSTVIVRAVSPTALPWVRDAVERLGGRVTSTLGIIDAMSATVPTDRLQALAESTGVREVTPDAAVTLATASQGWSAQTDPESLFTVEGVTGARQMWSKGWTGKGVDVALIDSGISPVPGLSPARLVEGPDLTPESQDPQLTHLDTYGHGTHLAGIIAGHDATVTDVTTATKSSDEFLGMAPDARLVSVKVADHRGTSDVSQVIAGIDWVVQHAHDNGMNIRVVNLSFGTDSTQPYTLDPLAYAAEVAWRKGIVVVVSAGNSGASNGRLTDPAIDPFVIAVGADDTHHSTSTSDDSIPAFSAVGDGKRNPDLVAPGVHVQSLRVPGSYIDSTYGTTGRVGDRYFRGSGTSQAAAIVTGAAALVLQANPALTPDQVKYTLIAQANRLPAANARAQGAGLLALRSLAISPVRSAQSFPAATGTGTLEGSRGSIHIIAAGNGGSVALTGELDLMGHAVDTGALAAAEAVGTAWSGGTWNNSTWTGAGWDPSSAGAISSSSSSWASSSWASSSWASSSWASSSWASSSWASSSWASSSWASSSWASSSWAGALWSDASWQSAAWS